MTTTKHTPTPCSTCNGVLAAEMLKTFTPERLAHEYVHVASRAQALTARVAELEAALREFVSLHDRGMVNGQLVERARAALAKVTP